MQPARHRVSFGRKHVKPNGKPLQQRDKAHGGKSERRPEVRSERRSERRSARTCSSMRASTSGRAISCSTQLRPIALMASSSSSLDEIAKQRKTTRESKSRTVARPSTTSCAAAATPPPSRRARCCRCRHSRARRSSISRARWRGGKRDAAIARVERVLGLASVHSIHSATQGSKRGATTWTPRERSSAHCCLRPSATWWAHVPSQSHQGQ